MSPHCDIHHIELFEGECELCKLEVLMVQHGIELPPLDLISRDRLINMAWAGLLRMDYKDVNKHKVVYSLHGDNFLFSCEPSEAEKDQGVTTRFLEFRRVP